MNREELLHNVGNVNEDGLRFIYAAIEAVTSNEKYNVHTSPERLEQIRQQEAEETEREEAEYSKRQLEAYQRIEKSIQDKVNALDGRGKRLINRLDEVRQHIPTEMGMYCGDMKFLSDLFGQDWFKLIEYSFCFGYMQAENNSKREK